jgi:hypothetical protein
MMNRCLQCNSTLTPDEKVCFTCETPVPLAVPKQDVHVYFRRVVNGLFILFAIMTVFSPFTDAVPSFMKCASGLVILVLVRNSADQMAQSRKQ